MSYDVKFSIKETIKIDSSKIILVVMKYAYIFKIYLFIPAKRYCHMIVEEGGIQILQNLLENTNIHSSVADICKEILLIVKEEHFNSSHTHAQTVL